MTTLALDPGYGNSKLYGAAGGVVLPSVVSVGDGKSVRRMAGVRMAKPPLRIQTDAGVFHVGESAHDWGMVALGRKLGWTGVALKTCKTQTGALLTLSWAKAHGMTLMVQDLTNPMLAQVPHVLLAAHAGTIMGVETNAMQFYPDASLPEEAVHPGVYRRRDGKLDITSIKGPGFGYRIDSIRRELSDPAVDWSV